MNVDWPVAAAVAAAACRRGVGTLAPHRGSPPPAAFDAGAER